MSSLHLNLWTGHKCAEAEGSLQVWICLGNIMGLLDKKEIWAKVVVVSEKEIATHRIEHL